MCADTKYSDATDPYIGLIVSHRIVNYRKLHFLKLKHFVCNFKKMITQIIK